MKIQEALNPENTKKFRQLMLKIHPDVNKNKNNEELVRKLIASRVSDAEFERLYKRIRIVKRSEVKPPETPEVKKEERPARFKTDEDWKKWIKMHDIIRAARAREQDRIRKEQRGY